MYRYIKKVLCPLVALLFSSTVFSSNLAEKLLQLPINLMSGEQTTLADHQGKQSVYLKFWATWCQPCMKEMPHFEHVQQQYNGAIQTIGINLGLNDDEQSVKATIEKFGLTMPMAIDKSGDLAKGFHFIGSPYHLLFDKNMNLVHLGHQANESLDNKLALLSQSASVDLLAAEAMQETEENLAIDLDDGKLHALFFTATWCDWYLKESRPSVSHGCINAQKNINAIYQQYPEITWHGLISRLWTGEKDLSAYKKKYAITHAINIDKTNQLFHQFSVKDLPTLILLKDNQVVFKTNELSDNAQLIKQLNTYTK